MLTAAKRPIRSVNPTRGVTGNSQVDLAQISGNWACADYVHDESFSLRQTEGRLFDGYEQPMPLWMSYWQTDGESQLPGAPSHRLTSQEERRLFLRYNYARYRLSRLVNRKADSPAREQEAAHWHDRATQARSQLAHANMALVLAMAKRFQLSHVEFEELVSEGNMALLRCIDKFNVSLGFKFSTYACRAILKSFHRLSTKTAMYRRHFPVNFDPELEPPDHNAGRHEVEWEDSVQWVRQMLLGQAIPFTPLERQIVFERFGLTSRSKGKTLSEIGKMVGLSTEGVRRMLNQALCKVRQALDGEPVTGRGNPRGGRARTTRPAGRLAAG
jgi:RNA polymerase sigma factor (sigma-70 family)